MSSTYAGTENYYNQRSGGGGGGAGGSGGGRYNPGYGGGGGYSQQSTQLNYDYDDQGHGQQQNQMRKTGHRRTVDYTGGVARWRHKRAVCPYATNSGVIRPMKKFIIDMYPPSAYPDNPIMSTTPKFIHASVNKLRNPVNLVRWTPEGRRILGASSSGEFTLWNGMSFNFETIMQAHDQSIRAGEWSHNDDWFISGDQEGIVKYWQPNMNNVKVLAAHREAIRDLSFSPSDSKFVTASDDGKLKIWNFNEGQEERELTGHGWDVKCVHWHPSKGLIVSGSKDNLVKLWDPRTGTCLTTLHGHKKTITRAKFQPTRGDLLATSAHDQTTRIFDLRMMRDIAVLRGPSADITTLTWHPVHESLIATGDFLGGVHFFNIDADLTASAVPSVTSSLNSSSVQKQLVAPPARTLDPVQSILYAHESAVWSMDFHPLGHILCTGSNDKFTKFWSRARPSDEAAFKDGYHIGHETPGHVPFQGDRHTTHSGHYY
ncbi:WD40-repeat-containing domain protein [Limtongia smithiae]|uniref:WD40-repeat-containing domain protein n=1 Tax=Limtongia smithiae TaxID=1125753 RepID=UPI0034CEB606